MCNEGADQGRHPQPDGSANWEGDAQSDAWASDLRLLGGVADMTNQIHACQAAACALWALCRHWHHPQVRISFRMVEQLQLVDVDLPV